MSHIKWSRLQVAARILYLFIYVFLCCAYALRLPLFCSTLTWMAACLMVLKSPFSESDTSLNRIGEWLCNGESDWSVDGGTHRARLTLFNPSGDAVCVSLIGLLIDFPSLCETQRARSRGLSITAPAGRLWAEARQGGERVPLKRRWIEVPPPDSIAAVD